MLLYKIFKKIVNENGSQIYKNACRSHIYQHDMMLVTVVTNSVVMGGRVNLFYFQAIIGSSVGTNSNVAAYAEMENGKQITLTY